MKPIVRQRSNVCVVNNNKRMGFETPMKNVRANKFEATQKWKEMIRQFIGDVPLDKNRRLIRNYIDTFTGTVGADTLEQVLIHVFPERSCDRTNAVRVLQKFLDEAIIEDAKEPSVRIFKDDLTLYRIRESGLSRYDLKIPARVRRSASLDSSRSRVHNMSASTSTQQTEPVRLLKHRQLSFSMNASSSNAPLAAHDDEEETPPKMLKVRYASGDENCENDGPTRSLFYQSQLKELLNGIINNQNINEKERHEKLMQFKDCYPRIFEMRYPNNSYIAPEMSIFERLKSFIGA